MALQQGFGGVESRAPCGQARASAGKKVTNLLPPCCHGIRLPQTTGAQLADGRGLSPYASQGRSSAGACLAFAVVAEWACGQSRAWLDDRAGVGFPSGLREVGAPTSPRGEKAALFDRRTMGTVRTPRPKVRLLTTREAAAALGVHERTLRRYIASGFLACRRLPGGHYRIPEDAIIDFWDEGDDAGRRGRRRAPAVKGVGRVRYSRASARRPSPSAAGR